MQKNDSTGELPAIDNVKKLKDFYQSLGASILETGSQPEKLAPKPELKPVGPKVTPNNLGDNEIEKPEEPDLKPDLKPVEPDELNFKPNQTSTQVSRVSPKPALPPKPSFVKESKSKNSCQNSSTPDVAIKRKQGENNSSLVNEEQENKHSGLQNGQEKDQREDVKVAEGHLGEDMDNSEHEAVDEDGWDSDEFESENEDSDDREEALPNKRASRIIFHELHHIPDLDFLDPRRKKLFNIAKEILTTEVTYVKTLKLLDEVFHFRLDQECRAKGVIPKEALLEIFSNISTINQFHRDFLLPRLEERMTNWETTPKVGDIFNYLAPFLIMYAEYVKNFEQAMSSLSKWKLKSPKFAAVIQDIQKTDTECNSLTLEHHMLAPVQRVPRYKLLLTDYVSKLPEDSADLEQSKKSLEIISAAANHANESMKKTERFQKMLEIQEKFGDGVSIVTPSREFVMEGELIKISARNAQIMTRVLVLFNDSLFYCTKVAATGKYKVKQSVDLLSTHLEEAEDETESRELAFRVCSKSKVADFQASSVEEKEKWVSTLTGAIKNAVEKNSTFGREVALGENELGRIAPVWVRDTAVSMCMACTSVFTTLRRRHHCRACGKIVCATCSSYKAPLEYDGGKINRVCVNCHKVLTNGDTKEISNRRTRGMKAQKVADAVLSGYLNFKSESTKTWAKRWCMLGQDFTLYVFRAKKDVKAQATIPLPGFELQNDNASDDTEKNGKHVFKVSHVGIGWFLFEAENDELLETWSEHIQCAIKAEPYPDQCHSVSSTPPTSPGETRK